MLVVYPAVPESIHRVTFRTCSSETGIWTPCGILLHGRIAWQNRAGYNLMISDWSHLWVGLTTKGYRGRLRFLQRSVNKSERSTLCQPHSQGEFVAGCLIWLPTLWSPPQSQSSTIFHKTPVHGANFRTLSLAVGCNKPVSADWKGNRKFI